MKLSKLIKDTEGDDNPVTKAWTAYDKARWESDDHSEHRDGKYHPSQITNCPAILFLDLEGFPLPQEPYVAKRERIFQNGDGVHERIQVSLARAGILDVSGFDASMETPISIPKYNIGGHTDGILNFGPRSNTGKTIVMFGQEVPIFNFKDPTKRAILEIKSINERGFKEVLKYGAKDEHRTQATVYCEALNIGRTCFIYENKNTQEWYEDVVKFDMQRWKKVVAKIELVEKWRAEYRATGVIPKGVYDAAVDSGKNRKPWGIYAIDLLKPPIGQPSIFDLQKAMNKDKKPKKRKAKSHPLMRRKNATSKK